MYLKYSWEYLSITRIFHKKKFIRSSKLKQISDFVIKGLCMKPLVHYLC